MARVELKNWRFYCDKPGCLVSHIRGDEEPPHDWALIDGKYYCQHHAEDELLHAASNTGAQSNG